METSANPPAAHQRLAPLTSVRGVAALVVVLYHLRESFPNVYVLSWAPRHGDLAVDLFFVLSGFILTHVYSSAGMTTFGAAAGFYTTRLVRIYPLHLVTLLATLLMISVNPGLAAGFRTDFFGAKAFVLNLFLVQNWGLIDLSWNAVSWSISAEWFMYLWFPFLLALLRVREPNVSSCIIFLGALFVVHLCIIEYRGMWGYGGMSLGGMLRVAFEFTYGMIAYQLRISYTRYNSRSLVFAVSVLVASLALWEGSLWFCFVPASIVILLHLSTDNGVACRFMSRGWLVWLGEISYSLYMWHWIVVQIIKQRWELNSSAHATGTLFVFVLLLLLIAIAAASNLTIEQPCHRFARRLMASHPKVLSRLPSPAVREGET